MFSIPIPNWFLPAAPGIVRRALFLAALAAIVFAVTMTYGVLFT